jgi:hypothetical protein
MNGRVARILAMAFLIGSLTPGASTTAAEPAALVRYGTTYGECVAYCSKSIEVFATRVKFSASGFASQPGRAPFSSAIPLSREEQVEVRRLLSGTSIEGLPERIGCPDCDDSGAEWIEVNRSGHLERITFEKGKSPVQLKPLIDWLSAMQDRFQVP